LAVVRALAGWKLKDEKHQSTEETHERFGLARLRIDGKITSLFSHVQVQLHGPDAVKHFDNHVGLGFLPADGEAREVPPKLLLRWTAFIGTGGPPVPTLARANDKQLEPCGYEA
jgi:hypothetical protein